MPSVIKQGERGMVLGIDEVLREIGYYTEFLTKQAMRRALYAGAKAFRDEARRRVPIRYGLLKKTIVAETRGENFLLGPNGKRVPVSHRLVVTFQRRAFARPEGKRKFKAVDRVKTHGRRYLKGDIYPRNYAHLVHFGTRPHLVGTRMHPGSRPFPFMTQAFEAKKAEAVSIIATRLRAEMAAEAAKRTARAAKKAGRAA